jgi:hypothetical protein
VSEPIRGKVARILNSRELVINVGSKAGVRAGMYFDVLDPKGEDIKDPDTKQVLGSLNRPKVRVQVIRVDELMSLASTYKKKELNVGGSGASLSFQTALADMLLPPKYVTRHETLKTAEKTWEDLEEAQSYVKTGDPVIEAALVDESRSSE